MGPWIKLYRKFIDWEWYGDISCKVIFLHLLLTANWKAKKWQGKVIDVGELVTSVAMLSECVGLSEQQTRTALKKLKDSEVITCEATNKYTIIKVLNYCAYQSFDFSEQQTNNEQSTNEQQTNNKQITTPKEFKNNRYINNIYISSSSEVEDENVFKTYEQNIGVLSPIVIEALKDRITAQGAALVSLAIGEAVKNNARSIRYIEAILSAWADEGITTVDAAKLKIQERSRAKAKLKDPKKSTFMNYPDNYSVSDKEKERIKKMMKEFEEDDYE